MRYGRSGFDTGALRASLRCSAARGTRGKLGPAGLKHAALFGPCRPVLLGPAEAPLHPHRIPAAFLARETSCRQPLRSPLISGPIPTRSTKAAPRNLAQAVSVGGMTGVRRGLCGTAERRALRAEKAAPRTLAKEVSVGCVAGVRRRLCGAEERRALGAEERGMFEPPQPASLPRVPLATEYRRGARRAPASKSPGLCRTHGACRANAKTQAMTQADKAKKPRPLSSPFHGQHDQSRKKGALLGRPRWTCAVGEPGQEA